MSELIDPRVDDYIGALPGWQVDLCGRLREVIHAADPEIQETVKRKGQPYFVLRGNVCAILAAKDHVNLFTYDGAIVPDPDGITRPATTTAQRGRSRSLKAIRSRSSR